MDGKPQENDRHHYKNCHQILPNKMVVHQVIGERETQKVIDINIKVPRQKPAIEQVINVYVNKVEITNVEVKTDTVIVCGHFDVKVLYVACRPSQPVHAVEKRCIRFTVEVCVDGARCYMDADATAVVEYVNYDCNRQKHRHHNKDFWNKYDDCHTKYDDCHHKHDDCHNHYDDCHHKHDDCHNHYDDCHHKHDDCDHEKHHCHGKCKPVCSPCEHGCTRLVNVAVVLKVNVKVMGDKNILVCPQILMKPKG